MFVLLDYFSLSTPLSLFFSSRISLEMIRFFILFVISGPHGNVEFASKLLRQVYRWQSFLLVSRLLRALMHGWRFVRIHEVCVNSFQMIFPDTCFAQTERVLDA